MLMVLPYRRADLCSVITPHLQGLDELTFKLCGPIVMWVIVQQIGVQ